MVFLGCRDQHWIDVDPHHRVAKIGEFRADTSWPAAAIQHAGASSEHGIDKSSLAVEIGSSSRHVTETLDVPVRMVRVGRDDLLPQGGGVCTHLTIVGRAPRPFACEGPRGPE